MKGAGDFRFKKREEELGLRDRKGKERRIADNFVLRLFKEWFLSLIGFGGKGNKRRQQWGGFEIFLSLLEREGPEGLFLFVFII